MALGRIRRNKLKVKRALVKSTRERLIKVAVRLFRTPTGKYGAQACIGGKPTSKAKFVDRKTEHGRCSRLVWGNSPQAASAKALKKLAGTVARRGRRH